jgi:polysaccharide export outer membrane protein
LESDIPNDLQHAPSFAAGETVTIATSTGSEQELGPIAAGGQPYLIADDGTITLPLIGKVQAAGKTPGELQDDITKLYVPSYYIGLAVTVTSQTRVYYVGGEVMHPGPEPYYGETTVTKAIQAAGDFTQFSSHTVWLTRGADGTRIKVNVDKALRDPTQDPPVYPGDQVHVPRRYF